MSERGVAAMNELLGTVELVLRLAQSADTRRLRFESEREKGKKGK